MRIMFVDDRPEEIFSLWARSHCDQEHRLLPFEPFESIEQVEQMVARFSPDVLVVGFGLGRIGITGADVIKAVCANGFSGYVIANSGGGREQFDRAGAKVDASVDRNPEMLKKALLKLEGTQNGIQRTQGNTDLENRGR